MSNYSSCEPFYLGGRTIKLSSIIHRYQMSFQSIHRSVNEMMKRHVHSDITTDQFIILQFIYYHEKVTSTQISQTLGVGKSSITALVNRLVQNKMIERERNMQDRRIVYLKLTNDGIYAVKKTEKEIHRFLQDKLSHFDMNDVEKFLLSLEKLAELMETDEGAYK